MLDEVLEQDATGRVACETFATVGMVMVGGEITTDAWVDLSALVRAVLRDIVNRMDVLALLTFSGSLGQQSTKPSERRMLDYPFALIGWRARPAEDRCTIRSFDDTDMKTLMKADKFHHKFTGLSCS